MSVRSLDERPAAQEQPLSKARSTFVGSLGRHRLMPVLLLAVLVALAPLLFPSGFYYRIFALVYIFALAAVGLRGSSRPNYSLYQQFERPQMTELRALGPGVAVAGRMTCRLVLENQRANEQECSP